MSRHLVRGVVVVSAIALALPSTEAFAQPKLVSVAQTEITEFSTAQLDALLASIALYPDELLTQILMASTFPLQVVAAARWLDKDENKRLKGDALVTALVKENWDPSVKSLIPFPQVVATLSEYLEWTQQLGYAVANQQAAVLDAIQRLRRQAQKAGSLKTTEQQKVIEQQETIIIEPASPETVYVPVYQPANVYGEWPYAENPPVYLPPPEAYYPAAYAPGYAWGAGLAFAAGAAVVAGLWGWARPGWGYGNVSVNPLRYNNINVNRAQISSANWRAAAGGAGGRLNRPPGGPVGAPGRPGRLPTNAIGRGNVQIPAGALNRAQIPASGGGLGQNRPGGAQGAGGTLSRPAQVARPGGGQRPGTGQRAGAARRGQSAGGGGSNVMRGSAPRATQRPAAFGGVGDGARAGQFGARGAQSRTFHQNAMARGGGYGGGVQRGGGYGGGGFRGAGGGGFRGGGRR
jgi:Protein of unknown function (DUF3300)